MNKGEFRHFLDSVVGASLYRRYARRHRAILVTPYNLRGAITENGPPGYRQRHGIFFRGQALRQQLLRG
ncbi:MAG: hypothetical protein IPK63_16505 [Candidatus Competibacteraceae bacterium]|nr:hypothetical protein [Candidatus Competibacteraceae bacterium]